MLAVRACKHPQKSTNSKTSWDLEVLLRKAFSNKGETSLNNAELAITRLPVFFFKILSQFDPGYSEVQLYLAFHRLIEYECWISECSEEFRQCEDGVQCIPTSFWCDDAGADCDDGSDEGDHCDYTGKKILTVIVGYTYSDSSGL